MEPNANATHIKREREDAEKLERLKKMLPISPPEAEAKTAEEVLDRLLTGFDWPHWSKKNALKAMQEYAELYSKKSEERVRELEGELKDANEAIDDNAQLKQKQLFEKDARIKELEDAMLTSQGYVDQLVKVHNKAVQECIEITGLRVEFGHLECRWEYLKEELEKLKK